MKTLFSIWYCRTASCLIQTISIAEIAVFPELPKQKQPAGGRVIFRPPYTSRIAID